MDADAWIMFAANDRESGCGLYSYLSSGKSSAMAISFLPMSFQASRTACDGLGAGLGGAFLASWAAAGIAASTTAISRAPHLLRFFIGSLLIFLSCGPALGLQSANFGRHTFSDGSSGKVFLPTSVTT